MIEKIKNLSIFLPSYNEAQNLPDVMEDVVAVASRVAQDFEVLIINDGSTDETAKVASVLAEKYKQVRVINHEKNRGYGASLRSGFYNSRFDFIFFMDADGQFKMGEIDKLIELQRKTNADLVVGSYRRRAVPLYRKLNTFLWQLVVFALFWFKVRDIDCGFKLIKKVVIDKIDKLESERGAFISTELLVKAKKAGFKIVEVPVTHYPRLKGSGTGANLAVIIRSFLDLFKLWKKLRGLK